MIFELPIDHFPAQTATPSSSSRSGSRSFGMRFPFSSASCLEINKAVHDEPTVTRATFNFGKSSSVNCLISETTMPRLSLSVPPFSQISITEATTTHKLSLCEKFVNTLSLPTVS